jgi:hypothetical protein
VLGRATRLARFLSGHDKSYDAVVRFGVATDTYDGRAVALADLSNHGALDVIVANQRGPLLVYRNTVSPGRHWIAFDLEAFRCEPHGEQRRREIGGGGRCRAHEAGADRANAVTAVERGAFDYHLKPVNLDDLKVVEAWKKAGAQVGWYSKDTYGNSIFADADAKYPVLVAVNFLRKVTLGAPW